MRFRGRARRKEMSGGSGGSGGSMGEGASSGGDLRGGGSGGGLKRDGGAVTIRAMEEESRFKGRRAERRSWSRGEP